MQVLDSSRKADRDRRALEASQSSLLGKKSHFDLAEGACSSCLVSILCDINRAG